MNSSHRSMRLAGVVLLVAVATSFGARAQLTLLEPGFSARTLPASPGAKAVECSPGGPWGSFLYVSESNAGAITRVDFSDNASVFASGLGFPVGMAFGPGPGANFGTTLYVADFDGVVSAIDTSGVVTPFASYAQAGDVTFDPTGAYGGDLFASRAFTGPVETLGPTGVVSPFSSSASTYLRFGPGGVWGSGLYATRNDAQRELVTIDPAGVASSFASGFVQPEGFDWAFGPGFAGDLFATDVDGDTVYRVGPGGAKSAFATVDAPADVSYCNGQLYVVTLEGECFAITATTPVTPVPSLSAPWAVGLWALLLGVASLSLARRGPGVRAARLLAVGLVCASFAADEAAAHDDGPDDLRTQLYATLDGSQVVPPVATSASGAAFFQLDEGTGALEWSIVHDGLGSPVQAVKIHGPAGPGAVGPVQINAGWPGGPATPLSGTRTLNATQQAELLAGQWYVSVSTTDEPAGKIRGQITPATAAGPAGPNHADYGYDLSPRGSIRVLLIFAEYEPECASTPGPQPGWPAGTIPQPAADWLDAVPPGAGQTPQKYITDYYYQASFEQYLVLGEYVTTLVQVPCPGGATGPHDPIPVLKALLSQYPTGDFPLSHSASLTSGGFDQWTRMPEGIQKPNLPNGKLDAVGVIWRNAGTKCDAGKAFQGFGGVPKIGPFSGIDVLAGFTTCAGSMPGSWNFFIAEYFHALYGWNNFHTASGAGLHTLMEFPSGSFSTTAQSGSTGNAPNAWDRYQLSWKPLGKVNLFGTLDAGCGLEIPSDIDIGTHPNGGTFCLRDAQLTGDAVRIKLPHIDYDPGAGQPVKNQYLILENHRVGSSVTPYVHNHDQIGQIAFNPFVACRELSMPGIYAYLQIGKDVKWGTPNEIYGITPDQPNALASWLFPLPADGRFDTYYDVSKQQAADPFLCGNFGNANIPEDEIHPFTVPNPFTGQSDLAVRVDLDGDGSLNTNSGGLPGVGLSRVLRDGSVLHAIHSLGDSRDAFNLASGRSQLRISTNPAPVPVYTWPRDDKGKLDPARHPFDNDKIYLNGLAIEIVAEHPNGDVEIRVDWDDYGIDRNVRWAGDIVLQPDPDDPLARTPTLDVGARIDLERGRSPTQVDTFEVLPGGEKSLTPPTLLTLEADTLTVVGPDGGIVVDEGSTLWVKSPATLGVLGHGFVSVEPGAYICAAPNTVQLVSAESELQLHPGSNIGINPALGITGVCAQLPNFDLGPGTVRDAGLCSPLPSSLAAWWPMDGPSFPAAEVVYGNDAIAQGAVSHTPARAADGILLDGLTQWLEAPDSAALRLPWRFTLATWIRTNDPAADRILIEKRTSGRGFTFALDQGAPELEICTQAAFLGTCDTSPSNFTVNDGLWHHVAVSVDLQQKSATWYIDGRSAGSSSFGSGLLPQLLASETSPLTIGGSSSGGDLKAILDEVQMYADDLSASEIRALYRAGSAGSCRSFASAPWDRSFCLGDTVAGVTMQVCNPSAIDQTFDLTVDGIAANASPGCTVDGPLPGDISIAAGSQLALSAGECGNALVLFNRPAQLNAPGDVACYQVTATSQTTGRSFVSRGSLQNHDDVCVGGPAGFNGVPGLASAVTFAVRNTTGSMQTVPLTAVVMCADQDPAQVSSLDFSLGGMPAGQAFTTQVTLNPGETQAVQVQVEALAHRLGACDLIVAPSASPGDLATAYVSVPIVTSYAGPACGNGVLDPGEECDDTNTTSGDGCWSTCETEASYSFVGTTQGGSVGLEVDGVSLSVPTLPGMTAAEVATAAAAAIGAETTLQALGVGALTQSGTLLSNGTLDVTVMDPGLSPSGPRPVGTDSWLWPLLAVLTLGALGSGWLGRHAPGPPAHS